MIAVQITLLRISSPIIATGSFTGIVLLALLRGIPIRRITAAVRGLLLLLVPVLLFRILSLGASPATVLSWTAYAMRLLSAVIAALLLLHEIGPAGIRRALSVLLRPLPRRVAVPIEVITATALFLIPGILTRVAAVRGAARVRFSSAGRPGRSVRSFVRRQALIYRAVLVGLLSIPQGRAEAMVVRGAAVPSASWTRIRPGGSPRKESLR
jgi:hypothetical protein